MPALSTLDRLGKSVPLYLISVALIDSSRYLLSKLESTVNPSGTTILDLLSSNSSVT